jgi:hypothetical protein
VAGPARGFYAVRCVRTAVNYRHISLVSERKQLGQKYQLVMLGLARVGIMTRLSVSIRYTRREVVDRGRIATSHDSELRIPETGSGWVSAGVGIPFKYIRHWGIWGLQRINYWGCRSRKLEEPDRARCCREKGLKSSLSRMRHWRYAASSLSKLLLTRKSHSDATCVKSTRMTRPMITPKYRQAFSSHTPKFNNCHS